jgi:hypothetical protein
MLQFICDYCGNPKLPGESWLNGVAAENVGTLAARREVVIDSAWRYERAVHTFAVHFCSVECKENFLADLFQESLPLLEIRTTKAIPGTAMRVVRASKTAVSGARAPGQKARPSAKLRKG